jgi:MATE family multidrug resistance protein
MGFKEELIVSIQKYISIVAWSFPFAIIFQGIKEYLQSYEDVFFANALSMVAVIFNLIANYFLVFGFEQFTGYGETGLAIASFATRLFQFLIIIAYVVRKEQWHKYSHKLSMKIFTFSLPIAFMFFLEVLAFCTVTMLSGNISITAAAANNIIMTIASIVFMVPLSVASAVAVKIGHAYGKKDEKQIRLFSKAAILAISCFIVLSCSSLLVFPHYIMNFITQDIDVINLGIKLLFIVAIFQISDSLQVVLTGILRGLHQTKTSSIMVFIGYWILGIPIGYYLAYYDGKGAEGLWIGLALSLTFVAIFMSVMTSINLKNLPKLLEKERTR